MKYIKSYEKLIKFLNPMDYFKQYILLGDISKTLMLAKVEEIKEYTPSLIYVKFNVITRYVNLISASKNTSITLKPEWPIEDLKNNIIFQSDNIEEIENYIEILKSQNKFNL